MIKFMASLILSLILVAIWFATFAALRIEPQLYLQEAPWWHMAIHILWFAALCVTGVFGVHWYWDVRSRHRQKLSGQPPQHAHK